MMELARVHQKSRNHYRIANTNGMNEYVAMHQLFGPVSKPGHDRHFFVPSLFRGKPFEQQLAKQNH